MDLSVTSTYYSSPCSNGVDFLSVLLGFFIGIFFTLCSIACGVGIAWSVNYNITRKLRNDYNHSYKDINNQHEFPQEMDNLSPGIVSSDISLSENEDMSADNFQKKWEEIIDYHEEEFNLSSSDDFQILLSSQFIFCLASGDVDDQIKYYLYAKDSTEKKLFLMETVICNETKEAKLTLKSSGCTEIGNNQFINYFFNAISSIIVHPV